jgi:tetratricopeptide (TPR) repeat protein
MRCSWANIHNILLTLALCMTAFESVAQYPTNAAALRTLANTAPHDTTKAQALLYLAVMLHDSKPDTVLPLCEASIVLVDDRAKYSWVGVVLKPVEKKTFRRIKATALLNKGHYYHERGDSAKAMTHYDLAYFEFYRLGFWRGAGDALAAMSAMLMEHGINDEGIKMDSKATKLYITSPPVTYGSTGFRPFVRNMGQRAGTLQKNVPSEEGPPPVQPSSPVLGEAFEYGIRRNPLDPVNKEHEPDQKSTADPPDGRPEFQSGSSDTASSVFSYIVPGVDAAEIAKFRSRLSRPVRKVGGDQEAREHLELGDALQLVREPALAMMSFRRSQEAYNTLRSDSGECIALLRIGKLKGDQKEYEEAFAVLDSARYKARNIGRRDLEGLALAGMADMCKRIEECGGASELYRRSIELAHGAGDKRTEARGYLGITEELVKKGSLTEAEPLGHKGLEIATEANDADLQQQGAALLGGVFTKLGRLKDAQVMEELEQRIGAYIADRDWAMDSIINAMRSEFSRTRAQDSLAHQEVRSTLETNWKGEQVNARKNRTAALLIALSALATIVGGAVYYRFDRRRRKARADRRATEMEIKALRAQMNPHFLFNALNSIHDHILEHEPEEAAYYLIRFSKLMRQVLEMSRQNEIPLVRELEVLGLYTELERMRLKGRFTCTVEVAPEVDPKAVSIPPMLLQPFVENAIWHGLSQKQGQGHLQILISRNSAALIIAIVDDGVGRQTCSGKGHQHSSLGTSITKERLELWAAQCRAPASYTYVPVPVGTRVELVLPWMED